MEYFGVINVNGDARIGYKPCESEADARRNLTFRDDHPDAFDEMRALYEKFHRNHPDYDGPGYRKIGFFYIDEEHDDIVKLFEDCAGDKSVSDLLAKLRDTYPQDVALCEKRIAELQTDEKSDEKTIEHEDDTMAKQIIYDTTEDEETGKLPEILHQAVLKYVAAWKECKKCMIELNHHNPIVHDPEEDKRYLEHTPALEMAETAYLQAYDEAQTAVKRAAEVFEDEAEFVQTVVEAYRQHAEKTHTGFVVMKKMTDKKDEEYADLITHHNEGKTLKPKTKEEN